MRYALKFGYNAKNYEGYARQPGKKTVEGEIIKALSRSTIIEDERSAVFQSGSRTDKGVSACGNVLALNTDFRSSEILQALNAHLEDIWFYGIAQVEDDFNPRYAKQRWYRYFLIDDDPDEKILKNAAAIFTGTHDFSNFARVEKGKEPKRTIDTIDVFKEDDIFVLDFKAHGFLWNMIRRIVSAIKACAERKLSLDDIHNALLNEQPTFERCGYHHSKTAPCIPPPFENGGILRFSADKPKVDFGLASPEPLILMDLLYDFEFEISEKNLKALKDNLEMNLRKLKINGLIYNQMLQKITG